jgi:nucleoside phosphorylase
MRGSSSMAKSRPQLSRKDYTIGWICAIMEEFAAASTMLDCRHIVPPQHRTDENSYILGNIGSHNIVMACLPAGRYGMDAAASVATQMLSAYTEIRFGLMVGIGGGVPSNRDNQLPVTRDIRLGDVVVSVPEPENESSGVVRLSGFGAHYTQTGSLNKPPAILLTAVSELKATHLTSGSQISEFVENMGRKYPRMKEKFRYHGHESDQLFEANYDHADARPGNCYSVCENSKLVSREKRPNPEEPHIHYGLVASGNCMIAHGRTRDRLAKEYGTICFEMEAAGLMDHFPCLVIRGISNYADTHKNDQWQEYAAATAAAYAKELILSISPREIEQTITAQGVMGLR